jgi:hypothetical protein
MHHGYITMLFESSKHTLRHGLGSGRRIAGTPRLFLRVQSYDVPHRQRHSFLKEHTHPRLVRSTAACSERLEESRPERQVQAVAAREVVTLGLITWERSEECNNRKTEHVMVIGEPGSFSRKLIGLP